MSRAFQPPDTLSDENIKTMAQVRRDIWTSGLTGLVVGSTAGYTSFVSARLIYNRLSESTKIKLEGYLPYRDAAKIFNRNTAFLSVMAGGALGSFLLSVTIGKNKVHQLHDIFDLGKIDSRTPYQKQREDGDMEGNNNDISTMEHLAIERQRRITARRNTMRHRMEEGHGLSDSHGGHWLEDNIQNGNNPVEGNKSISHGN